MPADTRLQVSVISPEATIYEGSASQVIVPAWDGQLGILPDHAPMIVLLGSGELRIDGPRESLRYEVAGGFLQVVDNHVTVLSEAASDAGRLRRRPTGELEGGANPLA